MNRQLIKRLFLYVLVGGLFLLTTSIALIWVQGYRINWQTFRIQKTGLIIIHSSPEQVDVFINDRLVANRTPVRLAYQLPGTYEIGLSKPSFQHWRKVIRVEEGQAASIDRAILYLEKPEPQTTSPDDLEYLHQIEPNSNIAFIEGELWYKNQLVSRFSTPILSAKLTPDKSHIIYQRDRAIRVIEFDGSNDTPVVTIQSINKVSYILVNDGSQLVVDDSGGVKKWRIRWVQWLPDRWQLFEERWHRWQIFDCTDNWMDLFGLNN